MYEYTTHLFKTHFSWLHNSQTRT